MPKCIELNSESKPKLIFFGFGFPKPNETQAKMSDSDTYLHYRAVLIQINPQKSHTVENAVPIIRKFPTTLIK
jgi:hypothetical protein